MNEMPFNNYLSFNYREDLEIMILRWLKEVNSEQLRHGYEEALRKAQEFKVRHWLFDLRGRGPVTKEDENWVTNNFFPRAEAQFQEPNYFAYLVSPSHEQHFQVNGKVETLNCKTSICRFQIFTSEQDAVNWLQESQ